MLPYKLAVKGQSPYGATRGTNAPRLKSLVGSGVLLPCGELYACWRRRSTVKNNIPYSLHILTFLTLLNIPACDSDRLSGWVSVIVLRYNSEKL